MSGVLLTAAVLAACAPQPAPRTTFDFMEDGLARDGVLARCNEDRDATVSDVECANARRAAATLALEAERAREQEHERESEVKLLALRARDTGPSTSRSSDASGVPAFGTPVGAVMPSMSQAFDVYADGADPLRRRTLQVEPAQPPANDIEVDSPQLALTDLAIVPTSLRSDDAAAQQ